MARKPKSAAEPSTPATPPTQRAYTLRLRRAPGKCPHCGKDDCACWRNALWSTHEAVNKGAKVFGDWLLTLRGGLSHELAEPPPAKGKKRSDDDTATLRKNRRIVLVLSWLSVEDERGAPSNQTRVATGAEADSTRREKIVAALRSILSARGVGEQGIESWVADCADSLSSRIRNDAVWVNRSAAFDAATQEIGPSLTRDEVWDILEPFFGSREAYLAQVELKDDDTGEEEKAKDLVQKAGQWLSSRFGTGTGAAFASMAKVYRRMSAWARVELKRMKQQSGNQPDDSAGSVSAATAICSLATGIKKFKPISSDANGILKLISGPGYKSATRNIVKAWGDHANAVSKENLAKFAEVAAKDQAKCKGNVGGKGHRPWSDKILEFVEAACGFTYRQQDGRARHSEFAVMLDHAARRVSIGHSWIKRAEAQRRRFEEDAKRLVNVPNDAAAWLEEFVAERSGISGATAAGGEYRIRRRAFEGWEEIVKKWKRTSCKTEEDRIAAAREVQADPEIDKFGDIQLFEALAVDDAKCVWRQNDQATPDPLRDYVLGHDARFKQRHFKVPAYRHPDPLRHPVFGDFGNSRWEIKYAVHEAAKPNGAKRVPGANRVAWMKDRYGLRMGLWNGNTVGDVSLRWSSKRLTKDLALEVQSNNPSKQDVGRADRLGRAASGVRQGEIPSATKLFEMADWNGRLQAPRGQLDAIAERVEKHGWEAVAKKMRDRIEWLVTFSAKLECRGPFIEYAASFDDAAPAKPFVSRKGELAIKHGSNDKRNGDAKLILSRLPGLRILSVDLGHRFAASCAVWEAISTEDMAKACREHGHRKPQESDLFIHLTRTVKKERTEGRDKGKTVDVVETTIYRRIGSDRLPDGSEHPAPWARLDRQFFIKLQGEERPARAATNGKLKDGSPTETNEVAVVAKLARDLDLRHEDADDPTGRSVDELMRRAVRIATLGLKRHGRVAKIAYVFKPDCSGIPGMGGSLKAITRGDDDHVKFLTNALADWHALAIDTHWDSSAARQLWNQHIKPVPHGFEISEPTPPDPDAERPTRQQRRKSEDELREKLKPIAEHFAKIDPTSTKGIHEAWANVWNTDDGIERTKNDFEHTLIRDENGKVIGSYTSPKPGKEPCGGWHERLRMLTDWIMGWHLAGAQSKHWNRNVGGLSLTRIATMRSLYQLHKSFAMRPRPDKVQGAPERDESNAGVAQSILDAMERMREQRVKQIASRIVEAALGVGMERDRVWDEMKKKWRYPKRPRGLLYHEDGEGNAHGDQRFKTCHAVVIENLRSYRPDELQTRRENKALMSWSAGKVRKYLEEACQLHGLHLRKVMPNYTSRQCSRTGLPGVRCVDVFVDPTTGEPKTYWWKKALSAAKKKTGARNDTKTTGDAESRFIVDLADHLATLKNNGKSFPKSVRVPHNGGELFVAAPPWSCRDNGHCPCQLCDRKRALQADLNAAANIGLRALLDPDFPGRWWYIPAAMEAGWRVPAPKSCAGAAGLDGWKVAPKDGYLSADGMPLTAADDETVKQAEEAVDSAKTELDTAKKAAKKPGADQAALNTAKERHEQAKAALKEAKKAASQKEIVNIWQDPTAQRTSPSAGRWLETTAYWNTVKVRVLARLRPVNGLDEPGRPERVEGDDSPW